MGAHRTAKTGNEDDGRGFGHDSLQIEKFDANLLIAGTGRLKAHSGLSNMPKPHVNPHLSALTHAIATTM
jgi:hypothetical protein